MFSFPVDAERQHPLFCHQEPQRRQIQTGTFSVPATRPSANSPQLVDVCKGLQYLHIQDIVHGDLKGVCVSLFSCRRRVQLIRFRITC